MSDLEVRVLRLEDDPSRGAAVELVVRVPSQVFEISASYGEDGLTFEVERCHCLDSEDREVVARWRDNTRGPPPAWWPTKERADA